MIKPLIALTFRTDNPYERRKEMDYIHWVERWGGECRIISPGKKDPLRGVSGLLLTGGEDIAPQRYGEDNVGCEKINLERDDFELKVLKTAFTKRLPILAICRGIQVLAVYLGGMLYQHIPKEPLFKNHQPKPIIHRGQRKTDSTHRIKIKPESYLGHWVQQKHTMVNSNHHQAIRSLPKHVRISAQTKDGVVEAIEIPGKHFVMGVQWHPERWEKKSSKAIIRGFLKISKRTVS